MLMLTLCFSPFESCSCLAVDLQSCKVSAFRLLCCLAVGSRGWVQLPQSTALNGPGEKVLRMDKALNMHCALT